MLTFSLVKEIEIIGKMPTKYRKPPWPTREGKGDAYYAETI
jgi:hypothetical protein